MSIKRKILYAISVILLGNLLAIYTIYKSKVYRQVDFNLEINPIVYHLIHKKVQQNLKFHFQEFPPKQYQNQDFLNFVAYKISDYIDSKKISDFFLKKI